MDIKKERVEISVDFENKVLKKIESSRVIKDIYESIFTSTFNVLKIFMDFLLMLLGKKKS